MRASVCASSVLPRAGRADQQDVRLRELDVGVLLRVGQPLVVVVHRDREHPLGVLLADHVVVEHLADLLRRRHAVARLDEVRLVLLADDVHAQLDAFVADEHGRARDQLADLVLALAAERAVEGVLGVAGLAHGHSARMGRPGADAVSRAGAAAGPSPGSGGAYRTVAPLSPGGSIRMARGRPAPAAAATSRQDVAGATVGSASGVRPSAPRRRAAGRSATTSSTRPKSLASSADM